jgi:hypothetical protein
MIKRTISRYCPFKVAAIALFKSTLDFITYLICYNLRNCKIQELIHDNYNIHLTLLSL